MLQGRSSASAGGSMDDDREEDQDESLNNPSHEGKEEDEEVEEEKEEYGKEEDDEEEKEEEDEEDKEEENEEDKEEDDEEEKERIDIGVQLKDLLPISDVALQDMDSPGDMDDFYRELFKALRHLPGFKEDEKSLPEMKEDFEQMKEHLDDFIKQAIRNRPLDGSGEPIVYGFSMKMGPDGKPRFQSMDNRTARVRIKRTAGPGARGGRQSVQGKVREPLTEMMDNEDDICLTMEIPGVAKEDINIEIDENEISVEVDTPARQYRKKLSFPTPVKPETAKATFNNGVLDMVIEKQTPSRNGKQRITIE
jgi:HSP20 family protein